MDASGLRKSCMIDVEVIAQDSLTRKGFDLSDSCYEISLSWQMEDQPGKLILSFLDNVKESLTVGSPIRIKLNKVGLFLGYIFKIKPSKNSKVQLTAYDSLRYLQNKDSYNLAGLSSSGVFSKICKEQGIKHRVVSSSSYVVASKIFDNESYYKVMRYAADQALINEGRRYLIRDNVGTLEHIENRKLATNLLISEDSLLLDYDYELSIDGETYNQIKLIKEDKEAKKRKVYIVKDSTHIKQWGLLQYFEKVDEKMNGAQIEAQASNLLKVKNRLTKTLKLTCVGDTRVREGSAVVVGIKALEKYGIPMNTYFFVKACEYNIKADSFKMTLDMEVLT